MSTSVSSNRKVIDPKVNESWTRGRAAYREKCARELLTIIKPYDESITSVMIWGLPWAGSAPRNELACVQIMAMRDGGMCCGLVNLSKDGHVLHNIASGPTKFSLFMGEETINLKVWNILTKMF